MNAYQLTASAAEPVTVAQAMAAAPLRVKGFNVIGAYAAAALRQMQ